jgi:hypothetical protein
MTLVYRQAVRPSRYLRYYSKEGGIYASIPPLCQRGENEEGFQMLAMSRLQLLGVAVIVSALTALLALVVFSAPAQANHSWNGFHWAHE